MHGHAQHHYIGGVREPYATHSLLDLKKRFGRLQYFGGQFFNRLTTTLRDCLQNMRQVLRLVAIDPRSIVARREVGAIGFKHQTIHWDFFDNVAQMLSSSLITNPTSDPQMQVEIQIRFGVC